MQDGFFPDVNPPRQTEVVDRLMPSLDIEDVDGGRYSPTSPRPRAELAFDSLAAPAPLVVGSVDRRLVSGCLALNCTPIDGVNVIAIIDLGPRAVSRESSRSKRSRVSAPSSVSSGCFWAGISALLPWARGGVISPIMPERHRRVEPGQSVDSQPPALSLIAEQPTRSDVRVVLVLEERAESFPHGIEGLACLGPICVLLENLRYEED